MQETRACDQLRCVRNGYGKSDAHFCVRVCIVETVTGKQLWLTLFDEHMNNRVDAKADEFAAMPEMLQCDKLNALISTNIYITLKKWQRGSYVNYIIKRLQVVQIPHGVFQPESSAAGISVDHE